LLEVVAIGRKNAGEESDNYHLGDKKIDHREEKLDTVLSVLLAIIFKFNFTIFL
jgi:hypothetical protein